MHINEEQADRKKDIICRCSGTTTAQIRRLFERGITELDGISEASGACSGCGSCDTDVLAVIAELAAGVSDEMG